jgi:hypothetical protein
LIPNLALWATPLAPIRGITTNTVANINQRVPILGFSPAALVENNTEGRSFYNGLQASLTKRMSHGLKFLASYTFSKNLDTDANDLTLATQGTSGVNIMAGARGPRALYGRTNFDRTHRAVVSYIYDLPNVKRGPAFIRAALNAWELSGVTTYQSGTPLTVISANPNNAFGATADFAPLSGTCSSGGFVTAGSIESKLNGYLNASCFSFNPTTRAAIYPVIGSDGRATGWGTGIIAIADGPPQANWDIAAVKRFSIRGPNDKTRVEFRSEFFNAFNWPQFGNPDTRLTNTTFGKITTTTVNPRIVQFALKVNF